jgi:excisionase family DNA binding protein
MKEKYLNIADASQFTTLVKSTLYSYVHYRVMPFTRIGGRIVFEERTLRKWLEKRRVKEVKRQ